jgi:hypothetical protein
MTNEKSLGEIARIAHWGEELPYVPWEKLDHRTQKAWDATAQAVIAEYVKRQQPQPAIIQSRIHDQDIVGTIMGDIEPQWAHLHLSVTELPSHSHQVCDHGDGVALMSVEHPKPAESKKQIDWLAINRSCA